MNSLTVAIVGLAISVLGAVWRISALVAQLKTMGEGLGKVTDELEKLHEDFKATKGEIGELRLSITILRERFRASQSTTPPQGIRKFKITGPPPGEENGDDE